MNEVREFVTIAEGEHKMKINDVLTGKEIRKLKRNSRLERTFNNMSAFWAILCVIGVVLGLLIGGTYSFMPQCAYRTFMEEHPWIYGALAIIVALGYLPAFLFGQKRRSDFDKEMCKKLAGAEFNADELMSIAEEYSLKNMFYPALDKRMKELGISEVPAACRDGYEIFRLPTKEDL